MVWSLSFSVHETVVNDFKKIMKNDALMVSSFIKNNNSKQIFWDIEIFFSFRPDEKEINLQISILSALNNIPVPSYKIKNIKNKKFLSENQLSFSNILVGRFNIIHNGIYQKKLSYKLPIYVKAGHAFGTGYHDSTIGCLYALEFLFKKKQIRKSVLSGRKFLEIGKGTGILTFAFCKLWSGSAVATDIDSEALKVSKSLSKINGLRNRIIFVKANGMNSNEIRKNKRYKLIIANILARPLKGFALQIKKNILKGGRVVLSGILEEDCNYILNAYRAQGFFLEKKWFFKSWVTLVFYKA